MAAAVVVALAGGAAAQPPEFERYSERFVSVVTDFCGAEGLTVQVEDVFEGRSKAMSRGKDGLLHLMETVRVQRTYSTLDESGEVVDRAVLTEVERLLDKDLRVVDQGDGTLVVTVLATGAASVYDAGGKAIARNPGQVRFSLLVDHAGTPSDPSDDEVLEFLGMDKESTGRTDDFCTAALPELLG